MKSTVDPVTAAVMGVAVISISATGPLTAAATAPALAMAFWRNALGFATLGPFLLILRRREVVRVARGERGLLRREQWRPMVFGFLSATALALHFAAFMTSTRMTSVAMATALVATQPVWQALIAAGQGVRFSRSAWAGLTLAVVGAATGAAHDMKSGGTALMGDLLALGGALAQAAYTALSQKARADVSTPVFSTVISLICGLELLAVCWLSGVPLTGLDESTQLSLLGLLLLPQLLGLCSLSFASGRTSPTTISILLQLETPVAALVAWWLMGQSIAPAAMPGLLLIIVGVTVVVTSGEQAQAASRQGRHRKGRPPYPHAPYAAQPPSTTGESTADGLEHDTPTRALVGALLTSPAPQQPGHHAERDPRAGWAGLSGVDSPTITLTHHGAGAFNTMYLGRPHGEGGEADSRRPHRSWSDRSPRP